MDCSANSLAEEGVRDGSVIHLVVRPPTTSSTQRESAPAATNTTSTGVSTGSTPGQIPGFQLQDLGNGVSLGSVTIDQDDINQQQGGIGGIINQVLSSIIPPSGQQDEGNMQPNNTDSSLSSTENNSNVPPPQATSTTNSLFLAQSHLQNLRNIQMNQPMPPLVNPTLGVALNGLANSMQATVLPVMQLGQNLQQGQHLHYLTAVNTQADIYRVQTLLLHLSQACGHLANALQQHQVDPPTQNFGPPHSFPPFPSMPFPGFPPHQQQQRQQSSGGPPPSPSTGGSSNPTATSTTPSNGGQGRRRNQTVVQIRSSPNTNTRSVTSISTSNSTGGGIPTGGTVATPQQRMQQNAPSNQAMNSQNSDVSRSTGAATSVTNSEGMQLEQQTHSQPCSASSNDNETRSNVNTSRTASTISDETKNDSGVDNWSPNENLPQSSSSSQNPRASMNISNASSTNQSNPSVNPFMQNVMGAMMSGMFPPQQGGLGQTNQFGGNQNRGGPPNVNFNVGDMAAQIPNIIQSVMQFTPPPNNQTSGHVNTTNNSNSRNSTSASEFSEVSVGSQSSESVGGTEEIRSNEEEKSYPPM